MKADWSGRVQKDVVPPVAVKSAMELPSFTSIGARYRSNTGILEPFDESPTRYTVAVPETPVAVAEGEPSQWAVLLMKMEAAAVAERCAWVELDEMKA